jgi:YD repeat-containing protein
MVSNRLSSWTEEESENGEGRSEKKYEYSLAGCVTNKISSGNSTDINWNDRYQITDVSINGSPTKSYTCDALGRRSSITDFSGNVTKMVYVLRLSLVAEVVVQDFQLFRYRISVPVLTIGCNNNIFSLYLGKKKALP